MARVLGVLLILVLVAPPSETAAKITMRVSPRVSFAPGRFVIRTSIVRTADSRAVEIIAESSDFYSRSEVVLDDRSANARVTELRNLPLGDYYVIANLLGDGDKVLATVRQNVIVSAPRRVIRG